MTKLQWNDSVTWNDTLCDSRNMDPKTRDFLSFRTQTGGNEREKMAFSGYPWWEMGQNSGNSLRVYGNSKRFRGPYFTDAIFLPFFPLLMIYWGRFSHKNFAHMKSVIMPLRSINTQSQKVATIQGSSTIVKLQTKPVLIGSFGSESKILELTHLTRPIPNCLGQVTCQRKICQLISITDKDY